MFVEQIIIKFFYGKSISQKQLVQNNFLGYCVLNILLS